MYSITNEGKSVVAERIYQNFKGQNLQIHDFNAKKYIDKLDDIVSEYNNTYHSTIKMKPVDVKDNTYIDSIYVLIQKVENAVPQTYVINYVSGKEIIGTFYEKELQKTK